MYSHIARSQTNSLLGFPRYRLTAQIHPTPHELQIIKHHRLHRIEIFHDPIREELNTNATAAHAKAKARGLFVTRARDTTAICAAEITALITTMRASFAFNITVADLLRGITITHKSLRAIGEIELIITECIDHIDASLHAAHDYADLREDIFEPGTDQDPTVPPAEWPRTWRL